MNLAQEIIDDFKDNLAEWREWSLMDWIITLLILFSVLYLVWQFTIRPFWNN